MNVRREDHTRMRDTYVQANLAVASSGGDNTAKSVVVSLLG